MILAILTIVAVSLSGCCVTYLFERKEGLLWRFSAGNVIGSSLFGLTTFVIASIFGFSAFAVSVSLAVSLLPILLLRRKKIRLRFAGDRRSAKGKIEGATFSKLIRFSYYLFFVILFILFFDRAMIVDARGIFTGGANNLGDLPFHLGAIFSFTEGGGFPPQHPSYAGAKFSYPLIADLLTANLVEFGASVRAAMMLQNISWAFSLLVVLEWFVFRITKNRLASKLAPFILFFSGGLGFFVYFKDFWHNPEGFFQSFLNLQRDYTLFDRFRWGNSLTTLFITQRSMLLGMPLTVSVLGFLWNALSGEDRKGGKQREHKRRKGRTLLAGLRPQVPFLLAGIITGSLPLIHAHSLAALFVVSLFLLFFCLQRWRDWIAFALGVAVIALPEVVWLMSGSATNAGSFLAWHFGFDSPKTPVWLFWLENTGLFIPLLAAGVVLLISVIRRGRDGDEGAGQGGSASGKNGEAPKGPLLAAKHLEFLAPFLFLFVISNLLKFAPWEWDNIKILIYWFVGAIPLVAVFLAWVWDRGVFFKAAVAACVFILTVSGALDVWRVVSRQTEFQVFDADAVEIAEWMTKNTKPEAIFLNAPTYNSAVALSGRGSLMRYTGHLSSYGIDYSERENDVKRIYSGEPDAVSLLRKYGIDYVLVSPREKETLRVNEVFFSRFRLASQEGAYSVYEVGEP